MTDKKKAGERSHPDNPTPAGPHARPELLDEEKTPGSGVLPPIGGDTENMQPTS
jgi:hypothetical protein